MKAHQFLPEILLRHDREKPWQEWVTGTVLFADVSGFTPMSEALSSLGAEGAEILTNILNRYFASMIGILRAHGGQVMKFGGDAILCFFPEIGDWHMRSEAEACLSPVSGGRGNVAAPFRVRSDETMENRSEAARTEARGHFSIHVLPLSSPYPPPPTPPSATRLARAGRWDYN